jgi:hypothetical protein
LIADNNCDPCNLISGMVFDLPCKLRHPAILPCNNPALSKSRAHDFFYQSYRTPTLAITAVWAVGGSGGLTPQIRGVLSWWRRWRLAPGSGLHLHQFEAGAL